MLASNSYTKAYVTGCRARVDAQVRAFRAIAKTHPRDPAFVAFEAAFFNDLVIVLESCFVHRARALEKQDSNPLNEVRVLARSMMENDEAMVDDPVIKLNPSKTVLKHEVGDPIRLTEHDFGLLAKAFFADLESKYVA